jgi:outer membrane protein assembly complex protein YaeT
MMWMVRRLLACSFLWSLLFPIHAQPKTYEGLPVRVIHFTPVSQPLEATELHDLLPIHMGQPLRLSDVRSSIERLFATGRYVDIQVEAQPYQDGVAIIFHTENRWFIGSVAASGRISSPPNAGQLANAASLDLGQPFSDTAAQQGLASQKRLLEANGLFNSEVYPMFDWETSRQYQQVNIRFRVDSGRRARFTTPVIQGDPKMDHQRIVNAMGLRRWFIRTWKPMTQTRVRQALDGVRELYQKEDRLEAKVVLESMKYDRASNLATPWLHIDAGPKIEIRTIGANISRNKLKRYVPVFEEHAVDQDLLAEGARNLRGYLQAQGFFEADVEFKQQRVSNDRASIDFLINTGFRHKLVSITIKGNHYFTTEALRERMLMQPASFLQYRYGRYSEILLRRDEESIVNLYQANGFRDVKVTHKVEDLHSKDIGAIAVTLIVEEGPQYFVEDLELDGVEKLNKAELLSKLSSVKGEPFSDFNVAIDRDTLLARYNEAGFPSPTFEWSARPAADPHRMILRYVIHEGPQQFVRQVVITGNHYTRDRLINSNLTLNPGDPLSPVAVTETQRRLYDLGVFARVDAAIQNPDGDTPSKYVLYDVEEARRYSLATGVGAELGRIGGCSNCLDAPGGSAGFSPRVSVDLTRSNLWGLGHSISLRTRASTLDQRVLLNYSWPRFNGDEKLTLSFTGFYEFSRAIDTFTSRREEISVQVTQKASKSITLFYRTAFRYVTVSNLKISPFLLPQLSQPVRVGIASINAVQDRRDDPLETHKGFYNTLDLGMATHALGSQVNFAKLLVRNATYHPIGKKLVLARSTQFGDLRPIPSSGDPLEAIPLAEHFFGGGGTSHRGFADFQAGPRDPSTGFVLGGTALLFNQTELRFPLVGDNIGGVLFHDFGNIYSSFDNISFRYHQQNIQDFNYMVHAVGFGIRYRLPIGPVRVDLGYALNPPYFYGFPKGSTQQDLINAGPIPCPPNMPNPCIVQRLSHFTYAFSIGQTF